MAQSVFERCGGFVKVRRIVSDFYRQVLASPVLAHHFAGIDMRRLIDHQTQFISAAMGGPASVSDDQLRRAHQRLGISAEEFWEMGRLMRETLLAHRLAPEDVDLVCSAIDRRQHLIVSGRQDAVGRDRPV